MNSLARKTASPVNVATSSGPQKAAIFLLAIGDGAASIWEGLGEDEIRVISKSMSALGIVPRETTAAVLEAFVQSLTDSSSVRGSPEEARRILSAVLPPERVEEILANITGPAGRTTWEKLSNTNAAVLAGYLKHEQAQTAAVVLSELPTVYAAQVLAALPMDVAYECIQCMLNTDLVQREVVHQVEQILRSEFLANFGRTSSSDNHDRIAKIFNSLDRGTAQRLNQDLDRVAPESAQRIRKLMFVFDDLVKLEVAGVQTIVRNIERSDLVLALKGASEPMRSLFLSSMTSRAAKILEDEIAALGAVRLRDIEAAQFRLVELAKDLASREEIVLPGQGNEDEWIY